MNIPNSQEFSSSIYNRSALVGKDHRLEDFICIGKNKISGNYFILDPDDYKVDECTLEEILSYLKEGIRIRFFDRQFLATQNDKHIENTEFYAIESDFFSSACYQGSHSNYIKYTPINRRHVDIVEVNTFNIEIKGTTIANCNLADNLILEIDEYKYNGKVYLNTYEKKFYLTDFVRSLDQDFIFYLDIIFTFKAGGSFHCIASPTNYIEYLLDIIISDTGEILKAQKLSTEQYNKMLIYYFGNKGKTRR